METLKSNRRWKLHLKPQNQNLFPRKLASQGKIWEIFGFSLERYWKKTSNNQKYYNQALMKNRKTAFLSFLIQTFKNWDALVGSFLRQ